MQLKNFNKKTFKVYAIEQVDESIMLDRFEFEFDNHMAFVFGNEVKGVEDSVIEIVDACIELPQFGTKHSLNISITAGIVIWEAFQQFQKSFG